MRSSLRVTVLLVDTAPTVMADGALPGELMNVRLVKQGDQPGQGVGYLEDGTMVVVEQGKPHVGQEVQITVTSVLQTPAGEPDGKLSQPPSPPGDGWCILKVSEVERRGSVDHIWTGKSPCASLDTHSFLPSRSSSPDARARSAFRARPRA